MKPVSRHPKLLSIVQYFSPVGHVFRRSKLTVSTFYAYSKTEGMEVEDSTSICYRVLVCSMDMTVIDVILLEAKVFANALLWCYV